MAFSTVRIVFTCSHTTVWPSILGAPRLTPAGHSLLLPLFFIPLAAHASRGFSLMAAGLWAEEAEEERGAVERATHIAVLVWMFDTDVAIAVGAFGRIQVLGCTCKVRAKRQRQMVLQRSRVHIR